jgi:DNA-binding transcriptional LysR family regulator
MDQPRPSATDRQALLACWDLLPTFQAVATSEHLPTAARALGVSPSAVSRAITALEARLGEPVFDRVGRHLRLNAAGRRLRVGTEAAMREVDRALREARHGELSGPVHLAATAAVVASFLAPALSELRRTHPDLLAWLHTTGPSDELNERLAEGRLDLALVEHPVPRPDLVVVPLFALDYGVYCGPGHPFYDRADVGEDEVLQAPFVGPIVEEGDRLPPELRRNIRVRVNQMSTAMDLCATGDWLVVLPRRIAAAWPGYRLWRLPNLHLPPGRLHLVHRATGRSSGEQALTRLLLLRAQG